MSRVYETRPERSRKKLTNGKNIACFVSFRLVSEFDLQRERAALSRTQCDLLLQKVKLLSLLRPRLTGVINPSSLARFG